MSSRGWMAFTVLCLVVAGIFIAIVSRRSLEEKRLQSNGHADKRSAHVGRVVWNSPTSAIDAVTKGGGEESTPVGVLKGKVISYDGHPAAGAEVRARHLSRKPWGGSVADEGELSTRTGPDGAFELVSLDFGMYGVAGSLEDSAALAAVNLSEREPVGTVTLALRPAGTISGTVMDVAGVAVEGATVAPVSLNSEPFSARFSALLAVKTDPNGCFRTTGLEIGLWSVRAEASGYAPAVANGVTTGKDDVRITLSTGGTIRGRCVDAETKTPLSGVGLGARLTNGSSSKTTSVVSDDAGAFRFDHMAQGGYLLFSQTGKLVTAKGPARVEVKEGEITPEVLLELGPGGSIRGRVLDSARGVAVAGARVTASAVMPAEISWLSQECRATDTAGAYEIVGLPSGTYELCAYGPPDYPECIDTRRPRVSVRPGTVAQVPDIELRFGVALCGRVVDAQGNAICGAKVTGTPNKGIPQRAQTSEDGAFCLSGFGVGAKVTLQAEAQGLTCYSVGPHELPEDGLEGIEIVLNEPTNCSISGTVVDEKGQPRRANVLAVNSSHNSPQAEGILFRQSHARTDGAGQFLFAELTSGEYKLFLNPPGPGFRATNLAANVRLSPAQCLTGVRLVYVTDAAAIISGSVVDGAGKQGREARVFATGPDGVPRMTASENDGAFSFEDLPPGQYRLYAISHPEGRKSATVSAGTGSAGIELLLAEPTQIVGRVLDRSTRQPLTNFEVGSARSIGEPDLIWKAQYQSCSDPNGRFEIQVEPGPVGVVVRASGYEPTQLIQEVAAGEKTDCGTIYLSKGAGRVVGHVYDTSGNPCDNVAIFVVLTTDGPIMSWGHSAAMSDRDGQFELDGLPCQGSLTIRAAARGYAPSSVTVEPAQDREVSVDLVLAPQGVIQGTVRVNGVPTGDVRVEVQTAEGSSAGANTDESGYYQIDGLPEGQSRVEAYLVKDDRPLGRQTMEMTVQAGAYATVDFDLTIDAGIANDNDKGLIQGQTMK